MKNGKLKKRLSAAVLAALLILSCGVYAAETKSGDGQEEYRSGSTAEEEISDVSTAEEELSAGNSAEEGNNAGNPAGSTAGETVPENVRDAEFHEEGEAGEGEEGKPADNPAAGTETVPEPEKTPEENVAEEQAETGTVRFTVTSATPAYSYGEDEYYYTYEGLGYDYGWLGHHLSPAGELNGSSAYCITPQLPVPGFGQYTAELTEKENDLYVKLLYYGWQGPEDITGDYFISGNDRHTLTHLALSYLYNPESISFANDTGVSLAQQFTRRVQELPDIEGKALIVRETGTGFALIRLTESPQNGLSSVPAPVLRMAGPIGSTVRVVSEAGAGYYYDYVGYGDGSGNGIDRFIYLNGDETYCVMPQRHQPATGNYPSSQTQRITNDLLVNLLYFGYHGPGDITNNPAYIPSDTQNAQWSRHTLTHIALTKAYEALYGGSSWSYGVSSSGIARVNQFIDEVQAKIDDGKGVKGYAVSFNDGLTYNGNPTQTTVTLISAVYPTGSVELTKSSANPGLTGGDGRYSLEGAVYKLYNYAEYSVTADTLTLSVLGSENPVYRAAFWDVTAGGSPKWRTMSWSGGRWTLDIDISGCAELDRIAVHFYDGSDSRYLWGWNSFIKDPETYGQTQEIYSEKYTLTTDAEGKAGLASAVTNTYILKEESPSPGFLLDETEYTLQVQGNTVNTVNVTEEPVPEEEPAWTRLTLVKNVFAEEFWASHGDSPFTAEVTGTTTDGDTITLTHTFVFTRQMMEEAGPEGPVSLTFTWEKLPPGVYRVREFITDNRYKGTVTGPDGSPSGTIPSTEYYPAYADVDLTENPEGETVYLTNRKNSYDRLSHITSIINELKGP